MGDGRVSSEKRWCLDSVKVVKTERRLAWTLLGVWSGSQLCARPLSLGRRKPFCAGVWAPTLGGTPFLDQLYETL